MKKQDIESNFYNVLRGNINILEFEKWVYNIDEELLNKYFGDDFYFYIRRSINITFIFSINCNTRFSFII